MNCPRCSKTNVDHAKYCMDCGAELSRYQPAPPADNSWAKAVAGESRIPVHSYMNSRSGKIAAIEPGSFFQIGEVVEQAGEQWVSVKLADGRKGFIPGDSQATSEFGMQSEINSWSWGLLAMGVISLLLSWFLNPAWGVVLIGTGIAAMMVKKRFMFIVFGVVLVFAGITNLSVGGGWMLFGGLQCYWGIQEFIKYSAYSVLDRPNIKQATLHGG